MLSPLVKGNSDAPTLVKVILMLAPRMKIMPILTSWLKGNADARPRLQGYADDGSLDAG